MNVKPVGNRLVDHRGFHPQDNTDRFRADVEAKTPVSDPNAHALQCLGGGFGEPGPTDDEAKA